MCGHVLRLKGTMSGQPMLPVSGQVRCSRILLLKPPLSLPYQHCSPVYQINPVSNPTCSIWQHFITQTFSWSCISLLCLSSLPLWSETPLKSCLYCFISSSWFFFWTLLSLNFIPTTSQILILSSSPMIFMLLTMTFSSHLMNFSVSSVIVPHSFFLEILSSFGW